MAKAKRKRTAKSRYHPDTRRVLEALNDKCTSRWFIEAVSKSLSEPSRPLPPGVKRSYIASDEVAATSNPSLAAGAKRLDRLFAGATAEPLPAPKLRKRPQEDRVRSAISKLYPNGTDEIRTEAIRSAVTKELKSDSQARNIKDPSWDIVARALGRRSK